MKGGNLLLVIDRGRARVSDPSAFDAKHESAYTASPRCIRNTQSPSSGHFMVRSPNRSQNMRQNFLTPNRTSMEDNKVLCALVLRLKAESAVVVAKCDRAGQRESLGSPFYGGRDGPTFAVTVKNAISSDPPSIPTSLGTLNFKFVQSLHQQLVYGGDADGVCKSFPLHRARQPFQ